MNNDACEFCGVEHWPDLNHARDECCDVFVTLCPVLLRPDGVRKLIEGVCGFKIMKPSECVAWIPSCGIVKPKVFTDITCELQKQ